MSTHHLPTVNVDEWGRANNVSAPSGVNGITFQAAEACTIYFDNPKTFGVPSIQIPQGASRALDVVERGAVKFSVQGSDESFAVNAVTYDIIFDS